MSSSEYTVKTNSSDKQITTTPAEPSPTIHDLSFWELILKLDQSFSNRSSRSSTNPLQNISSIIITNTNEIDFESSPLAKVLLMLDHPILNKNNQLMDKLFKLLSIISQSFQIYIIKKKEVSPLPLIASTSMTIEPQSQTTTTAMSSMQQQTNNQALGKNNNNKLVVSDDQVVLGSQLDLVIKALMSKSCTEDGIEFATILLLNISKINQTTRDKVLHLLLNGIRLLGKDVSEEINPVSTTKPEDRGAPDEPLTLPSATNTTTLADSSMSTLIVRTPTSQTSSLSRRLICSSTILISRR
ncbi:unnamed protein product [Rotaria sp. Silwood2]|nr:unnamed protein product [Rotaria sp. Silwood2]